MELLKLQRQKQDEDQPRTSSDSKKRHNFIVKPTEEQKKKLLQQRKSIKVQQQEDLDRSLQAVKDRSKRVADPQKKQARSVTIQLHTEDSEQVAKWKAKFNILTEQRKNWL